MDRKERLSKFNKFHIINIAKDLFHEKGFTQTTMDDIAERADCSKSTIYVYFKNKDEIFDYIVLDYGNILKADIINAVTTAKDAPQGYYDSVDTPVITTKEIPQGYYAICDTLVRHYKAYPLYFEALLGELNYTSTESDSVNYQIFAVGEQIVGIIGNYMQTCVFNGSINTDPEPLSHNILYLWASICGIISLAHNKEKYIVNELKMLPEEFMKNGFTFLIRSTLIID